MTTEYVPTTEWLRIMVGYAMTNSKYRVKPYEEARAEGCDWFDRWLAQHDAEIKAEAFDQGVTAGLTQSDDEWQQKRKIRRAVNPYRKAEETK